MKKIIIAIIVALILILIAGYFFFRQSQSGEGNFSFGGCEIKENIGEVVSVNIAQVFAQKQVTANNKPYNWVPVGYYPIHNSSDSINYYAFVFRKSDYTKFTTLSSLEQNSNNVSDNDNKYQFNEIASVWTGASNGQKLLMHHYRGIPEIVAEKVKIRNFIENKYQDKTIGNIIADSEAGKMYFDIVYKSSGKSTGDIIGLEYLIISKKDLVNNQEKIEERRYAGLSGDRCEQMKQAVLEREADFRKQWSEVGN